MSTFSFDPKGPRRGPYGMVGELDRPLCEECDCTMHPFSKGELEGYACMGCGWSIDVPLTAATVYPVFGPLPAKNA